jgi:hypothetical protein
MRGACTLVHISTHTGRLRRLQLERILHAIGTVNIAREESRDIRCDANARLRVVARDVVLLMQ